MGIIQQVFIIKCGDGIIRSIETGSRQLTHCTKPEQKKNNIHVSNPPQIHHCGQKPDNWMQMIDDAAKNIHIRDQAVRLLKYYAQNGNGFRPALSLIKKKTGIAANKVSEIRKRLVKKGLIAYTGNKICIDWKHIRIYAGLDKPIRIPQKGICYFAPAEEKQKNSGRRYPPKKKKYQNKKLSELSSEEKFYRYLGTLDEEDFKTLVKAFARIQENDNPKKE